MSLVALRRKTSVSILDTCHVQQSISLIIDDHKSLKSVIGAQLFFFSLSVFSTTLIPTTLAGPPEDEFC